ncbi:hypothetical protein PHISCL_00103 [Aspergillus sclerotialis]|uniref:ATPase inhibitor, mitochondrial n=1 Tax=Aspergillus sclerotialis TaxID=2070753 RepID=A0A3A3A1R3_9EURO|nr:hypothetical protein PHISCL_00103 [Aspergillus sclerotialis]
MAAGDTGAPKSRGHLAGKDQFTRREEANENYYVRKHEQEKYDDLHAKMKESQKHMKELEKHM